LQQQWCSFCEAGRSSLAAAAAVKAAGGGHPAANGCTDPANRLTNLLKGLAAQAAAGVLEKTGGEWVPLLLTLAGAVTLVDVGGDTAAAAAAVDEVDGAGDGEEEEAEQAAEDPAAAAAAAGEDAAGAGAGAAAAAAATEVGGKRKLDSTQHQQQQGPRSKRARGGLAGALNREGIGGLGFSIRAWRGVMVEWLGLLAASKAAKRLPRYVREQPYPSFLLDCCFLRYGSPLFQASLFFSAGGVKVVGGRVGEEGCDGGVAGAAGGIQGSKETA
jgi:hypothetical protein